MKFALIKPGILESSQKMLLPPNIKHTLLTVFYLLKETKLISQALNMHGLLYYSDTIIFSSTTCIKL